jgi:hypothetical protein
VTRRLGRKSPKVWEKWPKTVKNTQKSQNIFIEAQFERKKSTLNPSGGSIFIHV